MLKRKFVTLFFCYSNNSVEQNINNNTLKNDYLKIKRPPGFTLNKFKVSFYRLFFIPSNLINYYVSDDFL